MKSMAKLLASTLTGVVLMTSTSALAEENVMLDPEFMEFFSAMYADHVEEAGYKLDEFANKLQISDAQTTEWNAFKSFFLEQMQTKQQRAMKMKQMMEARQGQPFTTPEALNIHLRHLQQQQNDAAQAKLVIEDLYQVLGPKQHLFFDQVMRHIWFKERMQKLKQFMNR